MLIFYIVLDFLSRNVIIDNFHNFYNNSCKILSKDIENEATNLDFVFLETKSIINAVWNMLFE